MIHSQATHQIDILRLLGGGRVLHRQTVSLGVAAWVDTMTDVSQLMAEADRGLYLSKRSGRNRVSG